MKKILFVTALITCSLTACDPQSGMTKKSLEEYTKTPTPTPVRSPTPAEVIDPADVVTADVNATGPTIQINKPEQKKKFNCDKYNRVSINADEKEVEITGACKQIMINGDKNKLTVAAVAEIVINGHDNIVEHTKYANGKKPVVNDSGGGNTVAKVTPPPGKKPN